MSGKETALFYFEGEPYEIPFDFIQCHPDAENLIMPYVGKDFTDAFYDSAHSRSAHQLLRRFRVKESRRLSSASKLDREEGSPDDNSTSPSEGGVTDDEETCSGADVDARELFDATKVIVRRRCPMRKIYHRVQERAGTGVALCTAAVSTAALVALVAAAAGCALRLRRR